MRRSQLTSEIDGDGMWNAITRERGEGGKKEVTRDDDRTEEQLQLEISGRIPRLRVVHEFVLDFPLSTRSSESVDE